MDGRARPSARVILRCLVPAVALASLACSSGSTAPASDRAKADAGGASASGGRASSTGGAGAIATGGSETGGTTAGDAATGCDANRGPGIPLSAATLSASVDGQTLSGPGTLLWAAGTNMLTLKTVADGTLTVDFPGCEANSYAVPGTGSTPDPIAITYTAAGGDPQWACTYEDPSLGSANCAIDVTAYGAQQNASVTGTFSGVLRLRHGSGANTKTVSDGTFTSGRP